jgi:putative ABC transport system substrate-binding protein
VLSARRLDIFERMAALQLPAIYQAPDFPEDGGLAGYGPRLGQLFRQMARQVAKVLQGQKPSDLPVEQPTRFELVINLKTAKALALMIPETFLVRADEVVE